MSVCHANPSSIEKSSTKNVVVVGAGLAGLTAAYRLQQAGYVVDVYEARARPGGRVYTFSFGQSHVELGGQALEDGGDAQTIRTLIEEMGLTVETSCQDRTFSHSFICDNQLYDLSYLLLHAPCADQALWNQLLSLAQSSQNLGEVLDQLFQDQSPLLRRYYEMFMRNYEGSDTNNLSVFYISSFFQLFSKFQARIKAQLEGQPEKFSLSHVKGGNSRLIEALVAKLQRPITYNAALTKITRHPEGNILLQFGSNKVISADCVVLALPCSTLRDVSIEENLFPLDQMEAIRTLQYGTNAKLIIPIRFFSRPIPEVFISNDFVSWFNHDDSFLILYYGGKMGLFPSKTQEDLQHILLRDLPALRSAYSEAQFPEYPSPMGISWIHEEFSKGSYSNLAPGQEKIFQSYIEIEGERVRSVFRPINNQIFFAGEHYPATLEGAVESGEKVARLIFSLHSLKEVNHPDLEASIK
jgi:monoamine oxidase